MRERGTNGPHLVDFLEEVTYRSANRVSVRGAVGDGIHDDTRSIQEAIDGAEGGGQAFVPVGIYLVSGLKMRTKAQLKGAGRRASILKLKPNAAQAAISLGDPGVYATLIEGVGINGNRENQQSELARGIDYRNTGVPIDESGAKHILRDLHIEYTYGDGVRLDITDGSCHLENVYVLHANRKGFYLNLPDSFFSGCLAGQSGEEGFYLTGRGQNRFLGCKSYRSGRIEEAQGSGFFVNSHANQFAACAAQDNRLHGWDFYQADHNSLQAAEAESNGFSSTERGQAAYRLNGANNTLISGSAWNRGPSDLPPGGGNRYGLSLVNAPAKNSVHLVNSGAVIAPLNGDLGDNLVVIT